MGRTGRPVGGAHGCRVRIGNGPVTCAIAEHGANIVALDIDSPAVEEARRRAAERELEPEFVSGSFEELLHEVHANRTVDVFFLFAGLGHMTIDEPLKTLADAQEAIGRKGFVSCASTPNRWLPWDHHTSLLPFFGMLPDDLALRYIDHSERAEFKADVMDGLAEGEAVARND